MFRATRTKLKTAGGRWWT